MSFIVWSRKCGKCGGQFYLEENEDGKCLTCIQCGRSEDVVTRELTDFSKEVKSSRKLIDARELVKTSV
jgi:hypothetical protein